MSSITHNLDLENIKYPEDILEQNSHLFYYTDWYYISIYQSISEPFIEKYQHNMDWYYISEYQYLSFSFIKKYQHDIKWYQLFFNEIIPINTKLLFTPQFDWKLLCKL